MGWPRARPARRWARSSGPTASRSSGRRARRSSSGSSTTCTARTPSPRCSSTSAAGGSPATTCSAASARRSRRTGSPRTSTATSTRPPSPPNPSIRAEATEYEAVYTPRVPRDPGYAGKIGAYLGWVLPAYAENFLDWWRDRLRPELERNFERLDTYDTENASLLDLAILLEDAIDVHDRAWKIHWMLNFAQFSSTTALNATIEEVRGEADPALMGRLQSSVEDRNWDSVEDLWKMKEEIDGDDGAARDLRGRRDGEGRPAAGSRAPSAAGASSPSGSARTSRPSATRRSGRTSSSSRRGWRTRRRSSRRSAATSRRTTTTRRTSRRSPTTSRPPSARSWRASRARAASSSSARSTSRWA